MQKQAVKILLLVAVGLLLISFDLMADEYTPVPMKPNQRTDWSDIGTQAGMPLFPSKPVAGQPGVIPGKKGFSNAWAHPEYQNYPGSVEHYRRDIQKYLDAINPFNHRTLIKNFIAVDMTGATDDMKEKFAEPVQYNPRSSQPKYSGAKRPPVSVLRLKPGKNRLSFKIGPLPTGMYTVRLIGLVESKNVKFQPLDLIIDMKINDGTKGEVNHYVLRQNGTDNFYSNGEFSFHVSDKRIFNISVGLHKDSEIDFLVHNVDIHDLFGECAKVGGKTKSITYPPAVLKQKWARPESIKRRQAHEKYALQRLSKFKKNYPDKTDAEVKAILRKQRDDVLWGALPPINSMHTNNGSASVTSATDAATKKKLMAMKRYPDSSSYLFGYSGYRTHDFWRLDIPPLNLGFAWKHPWRLIWEQEGKPTQYYTLDDLKNNKPLPGLDFEVYNWGKRFALKNGQSSYFYPITLGVSTAFNRTLRYFQGYLDAKDMYFRRDYIENGIQESGRDAAMLLCRLAYDLPAYSSIHAMNTIVASNKQHFGRMVAHQQRKVRHYQMLEWVKLCQAYDTLFPMIKDNQELATAVGRFIPWVKTPKDVITMLDTHLIQFGARQAMYFNYFYDHAHAALVAQMAAIQVDPKIANTWVDAIFKRTWEYPHGYAGVRDFIYLTTQRDGTSDIGSFSYAQGGSTSSQAAPWLDIYVDNGGKKEYRLSDVRHYPRIGEFPYWLLEGRVAGMWPLGIGDVGGPNMMYGEWAKNHLSDARLNIAWKTTKDPRFAYIVNKYGQRRKENDAEWAELTKQAKLTRDPFMSNRTRVLSDWGSILEGGTQSDNFRFRHAAVVRIGTGNGHVHQDGLSFYLYSQGLLVSGDGGARGGYGRPDVKASYMHNVATFGKKSWLGHTWAPEIADMQNSQYMNVVGKNGSIFSRQVSLVEVDKGLEGKNKVLPRAYAIDISRIAGKKDHVLNFHGPTDDEFKMSLTKSPMTDDDKAFLKAYVISGEQSAGTVKSDVSTFTWRMSREAKKFSVPERGNRITRKPESTQLTGTYDVNSPRKFLKVHLLGQKGARMNSGVWVSAPYGKGRTDGVWIRNVHIRKNTASQKGKASTMFVTVWEPYTGENHIKEVSLEGNPNDAKSFAAVHVSLKNGVEDISFFNRSNEKEVVLKDGIKIKAKHAYFSRDKQGLKDLNLVGADSFVSDIISLKTQGSEWRAKVKSIDYSRNTATLDQEFPDKLLDGSFFTVGTPGKDLYDSRWTNFQAKQIKKVGRSSLLEWKKGAACYAGEITGFKPNENYKGVLMGSVKLPINVDGKKRLTMVSKTWSRPIKIFATGWSFHVAEADVKEVGAKAGDKITIYEIGKGDTWKTPTKVSITRTGDVYAVDANVGFTLKLKAKSAEWSNDGKNWKPFMKDPDSKRLVMNVPTRDITNQLQFRFKN